MNHSRDVHCNEYLAQQLSCCAEQQSCSANAFEEDVRQCLQTGMNAHLSKPVDIELLKDKLAELLGKR